MRAEGVPSPDTIQDLVEYIESRVNGKHDYGTCVYAMSQAAVATFNYVAGTLGCTGFQASCADMEILRHTRMLHGPFALVKAEDFLYPQYDPMGRLRETVKEWSPWIVKTAAENQADGRASPEVQEHWARLAAGGPVRDDHAALLARLRDRLLDIYNWIHNDNTSEFVVRFREATVDGIRADVAAATAVLDA